MLDILLLILKIIGIILAVILGLVILILLIVLFAPVKYNIRASYYDNRPSADVRVTAFFSLVRFKLTYIEELKYRVKVFIFTIYSSDKMNKADKTDKKKKGGSGRKNAGERNVFDDDDEEASQEQGSVLDSVKPADGAESERMDGAKLEAADGAGSATIQNEDGGATGGKFIEDNADSREEAENGSFDKEADIKESRKENIFKKISRKLRELIERIKELYRSLKERIVSIIDSIRTKKEDLSENIDSFYEVINDEDNRELVRFLWEQLKKLFKIIKPKKGKLYVHYGMDDPETTGKIAMYLALLYGWLGLDINILPDFGQKIIEGEVQMKGSIRLYGIIVIAFKVYTNKQFKKVVLKK